MPVLMLNSHVAYGYVGNDAAGFCLRRLGVEAWQVDTVTFSNHPGYGACTGRVVPAAEVDDLVAGLAARGVLGDCRAVLAGYLGAAEQGPAVLRAVERVRTANPEAMFVLDPVMGDAGPGLYVKSEIVRFFVEEAVPRADVVTPNAWELGCIVGRAIEGRDDAVRAARSVLARGPKTVLVSSLPAGTEALGMLAVTDAGGWAVTVPRLTFPVAPNGAGDALAGLFAGHLVRGADVPEALAASAASVHAILLATQAARRRELALIAAQDVIVAPSTHFPVVRL